jgi:hypothetical protein
MRRIYLTCEASFRVVARGNAREGSLKSGLWQNTCLVSSFEAPNFLRNPTRPWRRLPLVITMGLQHFLTMAERSFLSTPLLISMTLSPKWKKTME